MAELPPPAPEIPAGFPREPYRRPKRAEPLTSSSLIGKTMKIWISTLPKLLAVAALVHVPRLAVIWFFENRPKGDALERVGDAFQRLELLVIPAFVAVFAVYFVFQRLRGEPADLGRSVSVGFQKLGTALGITALFAIPQFALVFMGEKTAADLGAARHGVPTGGSAVLDLTVLLVSGVCQFVFALVFQSAIPAAVVEKLGVFKALARSAFLTSGRRGTIFFSNIVFAFFTSLLVSPLTPFAVLSSDPTVRLVTMSAMLWVTGSLQCVFPIVQYHELRRTKEGFGAEELAKAFD